MTFVYILLTLILTAMLFLILKSKKTNSDDLSKEISNSLNQIFPEVLKNANQQLITMADQKIGTDLNNKKQAIEELVNRALTEITKNNTKMEEVEKNRIGSFSALTEKMEEQKLLTHQLRTTAEGLKSVLSNNQMRGAFGEQVAEDLLKMSGFVSGLSYDKQVSGDSSRPDFTVYMPDGMKINVDSKFPYQNLVKMSEADGKEEKEKFKKLFEQDIKSKVKEVTSREYINPEKNTVDFVILFIPNEMIFSFIYERFPDLWQDAMSKKVILAGPFSFTAILRMVHQAYDNFRYQKNVANIIGYIKKFAEEFDNYNKSFKDIGSGIDALQKKYTAVDTTRTKQLVKIVNKIKTEETDSNLKLHE
ncbi:MAG: DNA recombination protein RmuC [Candidatus Shapirobacteria bacterium]|jgi:DNA recombination protein RmuC|nr:DNA recombination protein RmuC [Candidatus Shapirobacteria bacterium]